MSDQVWGFRIDTTGGKYEVTPLTAGFGAIFRGRFKGSPKEWENLCKAP